MRRFLPILLAQGSTLLIGIASVKLLSALVPPELNGLYQLFLSIAQLGIMLTHAGIINHSSRFWQREKDNAPAYWGFLWSIVWKRVHWLFVLILVFCAGRAALEGSPRFLYAAPALLVGALALALLEIAALGINALEKHWVVLQLRVGYALLRTFVPLAAVALVSPSFVVLASSFGLQGLVGLALLTLVFKPWANKPTAPETPKWLGEARDYGKPFFYLGIGGWLLLFADRWALAFFHPEEVVGHYGLAMSLASVPPTFVLSFLMQWVFPGVFRASDQAATPEDWKAILKKCDKATALFFTGSIGAVGLLHYIGPHLVPWLVHERYAPSMPMIFAAGMSLLASQALQFLYLILQGQKKTWAMVRVMTVVASIKTIGSVFAAAFSMEAFLIWLILSPLIALIIGRIMIRRAVFSQPPNTPAST